MDEVTRNSTSSLIPIARKGRGQKITQLRQMYNILNMKRTFKNNSSYKNLDMGGMLGSLLLIEHGGCSRNIY